MRIRTRLAILYTLITAAILLIFAGIIYQRAKTNREREFYGVLMKEAVTKANLFLDAKVDKTTLQEIYLSNREILNEVEVAIYNQDFELIYHDAVEIDFVKETPAMLKEIAQAGDIRFYQDEWQVVGKVYHFKGNTYIVTAAAFDQYGYNKLNNLLKNSLVVFVCSILVIYLAGIYFSKKALSPVTEITEKAREISASNLDLRLKNNNRNDELTRLANTFNEMLNRLESSFESQKHFVSNISHELRTPLAAIIAELDMASDKERSVEAYRTVIQNTLSDAKKLVKLSDSLLDFAKASYDRSEIVFKKVRMDEVLLDAATQVQRANPDFQVSIDYAVDVDDDTQISIDGNEYLLKVAFNNLIENGCKFSSDKRCLCTIDVKANKLVLRFSDNGVGISEEDLTYIFVPFYRGGNKQFVDGNGIGLPLTKRIVELHKGEINVFSRLNHGTTFTLEFPLGF